MFFTLTRLTRKTCFMFNFACHHLLCGMQSLQLNLPYIPKNHRQLLGRVEISFRPLSKKRTDDTEVAIMNVLDWYTASTEHK